MTEEMQENYKKKTEEIESNPDHGKVSIKINGQNVDIQLVKIDKDETKSMIDGDMIIESAINRYYNEKANSELQEKEKLNKKCKDFKKKLENSDTKIIFNKENDKSGHVVKITKGNKNSYFIYPIKKQCKGKDNVTLIKLYSMKETEYDYGEINIIENNDINEIVKKILDKSSINTLEELQKIVEESKSTNILKIKEGVTYEIFEDKEDKLLKPVYEKRKELLVKKMFSNDENDEKYNKPLKLHEDEYTEITEENVNKINEELINCSLKEIIPVFSLYYNNFINLVNNPKDDERVTLINRYINEIFIEENLKDQFMHMIRTDNKKPILITKLENSEEITLDDLKEEGKFRHIKAGYKQEETGLFGRRTRKKGGNKRNKTLKKMK